MIFFKEFFYFLARKIWREKFGSLKTYFLFMNRSQLPSLKKEKITCNELGPSSSCYVFNGRSTSTGPAKWNVARVNGRWKKKKNLTTRHSCVRTVSVYLRRQSQ